MACRALSICADKLEGRDNVGWRKAIRLGEHEAEKADVDLGGVLRSLSRIER